MPPSDRLDVSTVYSLEPLSSSLRTLTGMLKSKRNVVRPCVYMDPPAKQWLDTKGGFQIAPNVGAELSQRAHCANAKMSQFVVSYFDFSPFWGASTSGRYSADSARLFFITSRYSGLFNFVWPSSAQSC